MTHATGSQGTPLGDRRYPGGHGARDLTLTEKAVGMLALAEAGLLPKFQVVHHACSFDRCSCWCVYNPDKTLFAAIGPSERDGAVANKMVDKMNRDLAQIRARAGERQEAGGKGQEGEGRTDVVMLPPPPPRPPLENYETPLMSSGGAPTPPVAADPIGATNPGSAGVGGGTAVRDGVGAGGKVLGADGVYRRGGIGPTEPARDVPVVRDVGPSSREREGAPEKIITCTCGIPGCGKTPPNRFALPAFSERVEPNIPSVIKALVRPLEEFFGDRSIAMAASGRSALELGAMFKEASDRGLGLLAVRIERPIAGQLLVILEGRCADGVERGHAINVFSIPAVAKMVGDRLVSEMQAAERAVGA